MMIQVSVRMQILLMMHWLVMRFKRLKRITEQQSSKSRPVTEPPVIHVDLLPLMRGAWLVSPCPQLPCQLLHKLKTPSSFTCDRWLCVGDSCRFAQ